MVAEGEILSYGTRIEDMDVLNLTPVQQFYKNSNILVTGATGFLGKILIEKLLRSCPSLSTIYVLVRNKKGKDLHTRIDEMFDDSLFDRLRKECPKFRHKVVGVAGDCSLPNLGINARDRKMLIEEVTIVFHVAATVRFDEKLKMAVAINVRSPRDITHLTTKMKRLKSMIHVSTAYSNCPNSTVEEKVYPAAIDGNKLIAMAEGLSDKVLDSMTPSILGKYPNTYAFTKQVAEEIIKENAKNLPVGIFRPAIVISTYKEPMNAWVNNLYGPTGICAGAGTGLIRTIRADPNRNANLVPVDMCVNSLIATAWDVANKFEQRNNSEFDIPVYHYESSNDKPITWGRFMDLSAKSGLHFPSVRAIWYYSLVLQKNYVLYHILTFLLHVVPAFFVDAALFCVGKSPRMVKVYKKIHKMVAVLSYFSVREWKFESNNVRRMLDKMNEEDKEIFFCDLRKLDWEEFYVQYLLGIRIHLIQDPLDTLPEAIARWRRLYWLHQVTKAVLAFLIFRSAWFVVSFVWSAVF